SAAIAARKAFRAAPALPRDWDVFVEIRAATVEAESTDMSLPGDCPTLLAAAAEIEGAITAAGLDRVPGHNDGQASNILLGPAGQVLLVDFDCAGQSDPYYDLAALLNEACLFEVDWRTGIAIHDGTCRDDVLNRCRVYGFADDLLWGLRGLVLSHSSPRVGLEFLKYGEWRLLRARMALRESGFRDRLHQL
ncbi:MAG TPA: phosphotransferase, partial [Acidisoma sp.]|nr:phosphotransferase [Acidisoma sp.]